MDKNMDFTEHEMQEAVEKKLKELENSGQKGVNNLRREYYNNIWKENADKYLKQELEKVQNKVKEKQAKERNKCMIDLVLTLSLIFTIICIIYSGIVSTKLALCFFIFYYIFDGYLDRSSKTLHTN